MAIGQLRYENPSDEVLGLNGASVLLFGGARFDSRLRGGYPGDGWSFAAGERYLFDMNGLKTSGVRIGLRRDRSALFLSGVALSSPIGRETSFSIEPFYWGRARIGAGMGVSVHSLSLDGFPGAHVVTVSARMVAYVRDDLALGYSADNYRLSGEPLPGADTACFAAFLPDGPLSSVAGVHISSTGAVSTGVAVRLQLGPTVGTSVGYEGGSGAFKAAVALRYSAVGIDVGAAAHPVLGVSKSVFISVGGGL